MEAAASVVGIVSFGLGLAKSLQAFLDSVIEAKATIAVILVDVNFTASTLEQLQDLIDQDKATSTGQHQTTVIKDAGIKQISSCALECQRIYLQIIVLIEKASMQNGEDGRHGAVPQAPAADDPSGPTVRLAVFSKNVTKFGRKMRWPWLEPRIKRCQEHLRELKISLLLSLEVFKIADRARPSVARIFGTNDEDEMRENAEALLKIMTELRATKTTKKPSTRQPPGAYDEVSEPVVVGSISSAASTTSEDTSSSSETSNDSDSSASYSSSGSVRRRRRSRTSRAVKALRAFKVHIRKRTDRKSVFRKDSTSTIFEAYLIYSPQSSLGPLSGGSPSAPIKLPFGHRRLTREVERALRKCNPWDILLMLSPTHQGLVDRVVQQAQVSASSDMSVCLVAIDIDEYNDANLPSIEDNFLDWYRMVLFFRREPVYTEENMAELGKRVIGGQPHFTATVRNMFRSNQRRNTKRKEIQARAKQENDEKERQEAKNIEDREMIEKMKSEMEERKKALEVESSRMEEEKKHLEAEKTQIAEEKDDVESKSRALKKAEESVLQGIQKGNAEEELKNIFKEEQAKKMVEEERAKKILKEELARKVLEEEHAKKKAMEEKAAAEKAKPPIKFKDAVGRKFNFPFHLVQTWQGMEDLIQQAFMHVEIIGPQVKKGFYDLVDSQDQFILPSTWAATIKPGASITMRMWPMDRHPPPGPQHGQHIPPQHPMHLPPAGPAPFQRAHPWQQGGGRVPPPPGLNGGLPFHSPFSSVRPPPPPPGGRGPMFPPPRVERPPAPAGIVELGGPKKAKVKKKNNTLSFVGESPKPKKSSSSKKFVFLQPEKKSTKDGEGVEVEEVYTDDLAEDIDKELGLDDLKVPEQMVQKDVDELLAAWTNPVRDGGQEQTTSPSP